MRRMFMLLLMIVGLGVLLLLTSLTSLAAPPVHESLALAAAQTVIDLRSHAIRDLSSTNLPQVSAGNDANGIDAQIIVVLQCICASPHSGAWRQRGWVI